MWLLRRRRRFRVAGDSMLPTLMQGDEVLVDLSAYRHTRPRPGDVVVATHPHRPELRLIKRVASVEERGCLLVGDNPDPAASTDSRAWGLVPHGNVLGRVRARFAAS